MYSPFLSPFKRSAPAPAPAPAPPSPPPSPPPPPAEYMLGKSESFMNQLIELYRTPLYVERLNEIKKRMRQVYSSKSCFDDIEGEIVCLLLMHINPSLVYEFSPFAGWSTMYMLNTLDVMNSENGHVVSFDIADNCSETISAFDNLNRRWEFRLGNVEDQYDSFSTDIDYLFIDSDHTATFAQTYIYKVLLPLHMRLREIGKKIVVSVHDVFHKNTSPVDEGERVIEFLNAHGIDYFSPVNSVHKQEIQEVRQKTGVDMEPVHSSTANSAIFFILG